MLRTANPKSKDSRLFDAYSRTYVDTVNASLAFTGMKVDFFTKVKVDYLTEVIKKEFQHGGAVNVLDVGCGVGNAHPLLVDRVEHLTGIDISELCVDRARETNPCVDYAVFEGTNIPFDDGRFDVAFAVSVFHHVPLVNRCALAREVRRVLRRSGIFIIFEHNPRNPLTVRVVNNCEFDRDAVLLDQDTCESLMASAGFQDINTRSILTIPARGRLLRAFDRLLAPLSIGAQYYTMGRA